MAIDSTQTRKTILEMTAEEAQLFLLKSKSYVPMSLPEYFEFSEVLEYCKELLVDKKLNEIIDKTILLNCEPNHTILLNKDGNYDWRPVQIVHPLLYVNLVNLITSPENWMAIKNRFDEFQKDQRIKCISIPVESLNEVSDTKETILNWWESLEQYSISNAIKFRYCIKTDITNCYGNIYTHTLDWAIRGKEEAKEKKNEKCLGTNLDKYIRDMQSNQTNGIPQGGVLFDFIAEILLGYSDLNLSERLKNLDGESYEIVRYRDDYRIFSNKKEVAETIVKELSNVLSDLNMHFNSKKTELTDDIISMAIKEDKRYWNSKYSSISTKSKCYCEMNNDDTSETEKQEIVSKKQSNIVYNISLQKHLLEIYWLSKKHPNSGSLLTALSQFNKRLDTDNNINYDLQPILGILTNLLCENPRCIPITTAVISKIFSDSNIGSDEIQKVINGIQQRTDNTPNMKYLDVWLQRLSILIDRNKEFDEPICKAVYDNSYCLWNKEWIKLKGFSLPSIVDLEKLENTQSVIPEEIVNPFVY